MFGLYFSENNNPDDRACPVEGAVYSTGVNPVEINHQGPLHSGEL
jgi:hypothetical protein